MANIREKIDEGWIRCNIIIEVLGKPADYLKDVLKKTVEKLEKDKDYIMVLNKKIHDPTPFESMFSSFMELEIVIKDLRTLIEFSMAYMPSNIEIIEPKDLKFNLNAANDFVNMFIAKLHQYDAFAKRINFENKVLRYKLEKIGQLPDEIKEMDKVLKAEKDKEEKSEKKDKKK